MKTINITKTSIGLFAGFVLVLFSLTFLPYFQFTLKQIGVTLIFMGIASFITQTIIKKIQDEDEN
jgi:hypothetical protein